VRRAEDTAGSNAGGGSEVPRVAILTGVRTKERPGIQHPPAERSQFVRGLVAGLVIICVLALLWVGVYAFINWSATDHPFFTGR